MPESEVQRRCPHCAEVIQAEARKCRYCNEWLDGRTGTAGTSSRVLSKVVAGTGAVAGVVALLSKFTTDDFTLPQLLLELGIFGVAMYMAFIPAAVVVLGLSKLWPELEQDDRYIVGALIGTALVLALVLRFVVFAPDVNEDLDAFGQGFLMFCGFLVAAAALWAVGHLKASGKA